MLFKRSFLEAGSIIIVALVTGLVYNALSSRGIHLIRQERELTWSSDTAKETTTIEVPRPLLITVDEAQKFFEEGNALFVDARNEEEFREGRIKGAISLPMKQFDEHLRVLQGIPKDKLIVTYCSGVECEQSIELGEKLASLGYSKVRIFFSGWIDWQQRKLPIESGLR